jgi:hypothetical protein
MRSKSSAKSKSTMPPIELRLSHVEAVHLKRLLVAGAKADVSVMINSRDSSTKHLALTSLFVASELCEHLDEVCLPVVFGWYGLEEFPAITPA